jgi:hypothetical protein
VVVALQDVACPDPGNLSVGGVEDQVLSLTPPAVGALPPGEDALPVVALHLEVHHVLGLAAHRAQPHRLAFAIEDHGPVLGRILLPGTILGGDEEVAFVRIASSPRHLDRRRLQVRA